MDAHSRISRRLTILVPILSLLLLSGCASHTGAPRLSRVSGESVVMVGTQPARLAIPPVRRKPLDVRSTYSPNLTNTVHYEIGRDFTVDYETGEIRRTLQSRMPDFRTNMLFGVEDFDHSKYPGFGNDKFFVFVDYASKRSMDWPVQQSQVELLPETRRKLKEGARVKVVAYGDSITAGGDASKPDLIYWKRWTDDLQKRYPRAKVEAFNGATGGDRTGEGIARLNDKVLTQKPDLVLIGFGMNDHNIGGYGTPLADFEKNLTTIIDRVRKETGAEIILLSTFPPNPKWHYGSRNMAAYAAATEKVARAKNCAFADVYQNWKAIEGKKKPEDLLGNNINHPNDFGHWMYFQVLRKIGL